MTVEDMKLRYPNAKDLTKENAKEVILQSVKAFSLAKKISALYYDKWLAEHQTELGDLDEFHTPEEYIKAMKDNLMTEEGREEIRVILEKIISDTDVEEFHKTAIECKEELLKL